MPPSLPHPPSRRSDLYPRFCTFDEDDALQFLEEEAEDDDVRQTHLPWKILIVDDDQNVHDTTVLALGGVKIGGRPLQLLHAYSAKEAEALIMQDGEIALLLLDVVMETVDAGLRLVETLRTRLGRHDLRIILRTGQPGYAPEQQVNQQYAVDGYTTKSQLTRSMLISVLEDTLGKPSHSDARPN